MSEPEKLANVQGLAQPAAPSLKERAESLVAWAAIAYAGGFLTIMLHTARLGIPVVQLIEPINVWVGLPLAAVAMISKRLLKIVIHRHCTLKQEFTSIRQQFLELNNSPTIAVLDRFTDSLMQFLMFPPLAWFLGWFYFAVLRPRLDDYITQNPAAAKIPERTLRWVSRVVAVARGLRAGMTYLNVMLSVSLVPLALILYVWVAYPKIPQEYGGGRPTIVQLAVSSEAIPADGGDFSTLFARPSPTTGSKTRTTVPVRFLFATDDYWYLQLHKGERVLAIRSEKISAVVWRKSHGRQIDPLSPAPPLTSTPTPIPTPSPTVTSSPTPAPTPTATATRGLVLSFKRWPRRWAQEGSKR